MVRLEGFRLAAFTSCTADRIVCSAVISSGHGKDVLGSSLGLLASIIFIQVVFWIITTATVTKNGKLTNTKFWSNDIVSFIVSIVSPLYSPIYDE